MAKKPWEEDYGSSAPKTSGKPWEQNFTSGNLSKKSEIESLFSGAADALTFGWGDELLGLGGGLLGQDGDEITRWSRNQQRLAQLDNPLWYGGGQLGGAMVGGFGVGGLARAGLAGAKLATTGGPLSRIIASAAAGGVGGGVYGAGSGDEDKLGSGLEGALWGAALGGGLRALGEPIGQAWRSAIQPAFDPKMRAARMIAKGEQRFGQTPQELKDAMAEAPDNAIMMDVMPGGTQTVMGAGTRPSAQKETLRELLDSRNNAMADEAADDLWESVLGKKHRIDAGRRINEIGDLKTKITYDDIDKNVVNVSDPKNKMAVDFVSHHLKSPDSAFKGAIRETLEEMRVGDPGKTGLRAVGDAQWDYHALTQPKFWRTLWTKVREDVQAANKAAKISGQGKSAARQLQLDANSLRSEIGRMLGKDWEAKQAAFKALADEESALNFGYKALSFAGDIKLGAFLNRFNKLSENQKHWTRQGALAAVEDAMNKADTGSGRADVLRSIIGNKSKVITLNHILGRVTKDGGVDQRYGIAKVLDRLEKQRELFDNSVRSGIGVNSHTADKTAALMSQMAVTNPTIGGIKGALLKAAFGEGADEFDEAVSNEVLRLMGRPVREVESEINAAGGIKRWLDQKSILAIAMQAQKPEFRRRALSQSLAGGLYTNIGGDALVTGVTGQ